MSNINYKSTASSCLLRYLRSFDNRITEDQLCSFDRVFKSITDLGEFLVASELIGLKYDFYEIENLKGVPITSLSFPLLIIDSIDSTNKEFILLLKHNTRLVFVGCNEAHGEHGLTLEEFLPSIQGRYCVELHPTVAFDRFLFQLNGVDIKALFKKFLNTNSQLGITFIISCVLFSGLLSVSVIMFVKGLAILGFISLLAFFFIRHFNNLACERICLHLLNEKTNSELGQMFELESKATVDFDLIKTYRAISNAAVYHFVFIGVSVALISLYVVEGLIVVGLSISILYTFIYLGKRSSTASLLIPFQRLNTFLFNCASVSNDLILLKKEVVYRCGLRHLIDHVANAYFKLERRTQQGELMIINCIVSSFILIEVILDIQFEVHVMYFGILLAIVEILRSFHSILIHYNLYMSTGRKIVPFSNKLEFITHHNTSETVSQQINEAIDLRRIPNIILPIKDVPSLIKKLTEVFEYFTENYRLSLNCSLMLSTIHENITLQPTLLIKPADNDETETLLRRLPSSTLQSEVINVIGMSSPFAIGLSNYQKMVIFLARAVYNERKIILIESGLDLLNFEERHLFIKILKELVGEYTFLCFSSSAHAGVQNIVSTPCGIV